MMSENYVSSSIEYYVPKVEQKPERPEVSAQLFYSSSDFEAWLGSLGHPPCKRPARYPACGTFYNGKASVFNEIPVAIGADSNLAIHKLCMNYAYLCKAEPTKTHTIKLRGIVLANVNNKDLQIHLSDQDVTDLIIKEISPGKYANQFNVAVFVKNVENLTDGYRNLRTWGWSLGLEIVTSHK
ncbi:hypothetical protein AH06_207 [Erwinia phage AH06]|nr:hypothetical protein AH06_207 [Erwinia phage AH06]